jgi:hypothetical protein
VFSSFRISDGSKKGNAILVTGRGGPHFLANRLGDGGEVVSLRRRPLITSQEDSWY